MIYLDNAATTLKRPESVYKAVEYALKSFGNPGRGAHRAALEAAECVYNTREALCRLLGAESPSCISFTSNATEALNTAIFGIFEKGDHIISTVCEHNSVLRPLHLLEMQGIHTDYIGIYENGRLKYDEIEKLIRPNTKAFVINHASNITGNVTDTAPFSRLKEKYGIMLILDGAQTAGILPTNVVKESIDVYCFTGHKGLMGPQGTGGLYVSPNIKIRPLKSGGSGFHSYDKLHPSQMPEALEAGTLNCHSLAGLEAALKYSEEIGTAEIYKHESILAKCLYESIKDIENITIYGDFSSERRVPIISINIGDYPSSYVSAILSEEYDIAVRAGAHCAPMLHTALGTAKRGAVRFSIGFFNTQEEIEKAAEAIREIAKS